MLLVEQKQKVKIDFNRFDSLLTQSSRVLNVSMEIQTLEGKTMISANGNSGNVDCNMQGVDSEVYRAESFDLFRQIEKTRQTVVQECYANFEIIGIPLTCNHELVGILLACKRPDKGNSGNNVIEFLEEIADRISSDIQNSFEIDNIAQELSDKYEELNLIYDLGRNLGTISTARKAVQFTIKQLQETFSADIALVTIPGNNMHEISYGNPIYLPTDIDEKSIIDKVDKFIIEQFASHDTFRPYIVLDDVCKDIKLSQIFNTPLRMLAVPIKLKGAVTGSLCIFNFNQGKPFQTGDTHLLTSLAEQMSMAITNVELYQNMKDLLLNVIKALVFSIEAKDSYIRGHSERVNTLTMMIADALEISPDEKDALNWASVLHDIGKIGVPEEILTKKGKLTQEEFSLIKEHSEKGYKILMPIDQFKESLNGIRHHHERIDGAGYPLGLKGEEIPLQARIIAIADTYDAMTSCRSYRSELSHEDAMAEIIRVKGTQLDPEIVEIFINLLSNPFCIYTNNAESMQLQ